MDTKLLFEKAKNAGITEIEVYRQKTTNSEIGIFNHQVESLNWKDQKVNMLILSHLMFVFELFLL